MTNGGLSLPGDGLVLTNGGGGGGGGAITGTFTTQANPVIPLVAGKRFFIISLFDITSNMAPSDGNQFGLQTSPNLDGSSPDTSSNYLSLIGANSANSLVNAFSAGHWNGTLGGATPVQANMSIDAGAADAHFNAFGSCDQVAVDNTRTIFNLQWYKVPTGLVQSFVMVPVNTDPTLRFSGSYYVVPVG